MTEKKLNSIYDALVDKYDGELSYDFVLEAMKQAVNRAYDNAAFHAQVTNGEHVEDRLPASEPDSYWVDKQSILNLKVK